MDSVDLPHRVVDGPMSGSGYRGEVTVLAVLLFLNAAFNALVWPRFYTRIAKDPRARDAAGKPTTFLTVHVVLISIALVLALASALAGIAALTGSL
jgi:hypothetical protein